VLYRNFATQEELDAQYDLERVVPSAASYTQLYLRESERAREELSHSLDVPFGPTLAEHLGLYPAPDIGRGAPVPVYLHGGYWRARSS
jgi:arylformamidase